MFTSCLTGSQALEILFLLALVAGLDVLFRGLAFERVESVAIELGIFGTLYNVHASLQPAAPDATIKKAVIGTICLLVMIALHKIYLKKLENRLEESFEQLKTKRPSNVKLEALALIADLSVYATPITLNRRVRFGKMRKIRRICRGLDEMKFPGDLVGEESFLLTKSARVCMGTIFFVLGAVSILLPII